MSFVLVGRHAIYNAPANLTIFLHYIFCRKRFIKIITIEQQYLSTLRFDSFSVTTCVVCTTTGISLRYGVRSVVLEDGGDEGREIGHIDGC